jgi:lipopolysaccharide transport system permease protein
MTSQEVRLADHVGNARVQRISPPRLSDIWVTLRVLPSQYSLLSMMVWRTISVRYKQSILGVVWVALQPIATTLVIFFMFNIIGADTSGGAPKGLFLFIGVMTWQFFTRAVLDGTASLLANSGIVTKIFVPRLLFPVASVLSACVDLFVMLVFLLIACLFYGVGLSEKLLLLPVFLIFVLLAATAISILLSPVNALFRDVTFVIPFALQFGMFLTPVLYTASRVSESWRWIYYLNPMASLMEGMRWTILPHSAAPDPLFLSINIFTILALLGSSFVLFNRLESIVIDKI